MGVLALSIHLIGINGLCLEGLKLISCTCVESLHPHSSAWSSKKSNLIMRPDRESQLYVFCWTLSLEEFVINSCLVLVSLWDTGDNKILWHLNWNVLPPRPKFGIHHSPLATGWIITICVYISPFVIDLLWDLILGPHFFYVIALRVENPWNWGVIH
jgi:hypothetical protein